MTIIPNKRFYYTCARNLTHWYKIYKRDLPWRHTRDPYAVLVSELMLQQTQVERVKKYFSKWMERFPTLKDLAATNEEQVIELWQGLGYYNRARNLYKTAQLLIKQGHESLPADPTQLSRLPGLGPYTVGAICSIAFDMPIPAVDGNVRRVFSRLLDLESDPSQKEGSNLISQTVKHILLIGAPAILTQAFMELGATICIPGTLPRCADCPVAEICTASKNGTCAQRPVTAHRVKITRRNGAALLLGDETAGWIVRKRLKGGLWSDFFEIPWLMGNDGDDYQACLHRLCIQDEISAVCTDTGLVEKLNFTRWQIQMRLFVAPAQQVYDSARQIRAEEFCSIPMPAGLKRLVLKYFASSNQLALFPQKK